MFFLDLDPVDWPWAILSRTSRSTGVDTTDFVMTRTFSRPTNTTRYGNISLKHINMNNVNFRYICLTLHNYTEYMVNVLKYRTVGLMMFNSKKTRYTCRMKLGKPFNLSPNISYIWRLLICIIFILQHRLRSDNWAYPPLSVGVSPNSEQKLTDIRREATTVTTALRARPHLDFTISIFPVTQTKKNIRDWSMSLNN